MYILTRLASQVNGTKETNRRVATECIEEPGLLEDIAAGLDEPEPKLISDCAEVLSHVASLRPELAAPFAGRVLPLLNSRSNCSRWESALVLGYVAHLRPELFAATLPRLAQAVRQDKSIVVRDYSLFAIARYAGAGPDTARQAYPYLLEGLDLWESRHAALALDGLKSVAAHLPELCPEIYEAALFFKNHPRGMINKAARSVLKAVQRAG